ncbi:predicted protein [Chaetoceros tenuissimus]|uniref:Uncharacterized protein n=1 Tax=Chaetoceros tenuissimus TaxID=426638 RepID=A0AAD3CJ79_9STRA|nr:predicted protein [Chaetoceros tenuissimus]
MIREDEVREGSGTIFVTGEMQRHEENEEFSPLLDMSHDASISLREHVNSLRDNIVTPFEYNGGGGTDAKEEQLSTAQYLAFGRSCLSQQFQNISRKFESDDVEIERLTPLLTSNEPRRKSKSSMICRLCGCFSLMFHCGNKGDIHIFTSGFFFMFSALTDMIILMRETLHVDEAEEPSGLELADFVESITRRNINIL